MEELCFWNAEQSNSSWSALVYDLPESFYVQLKVGIES